MTHVFWTVQVDGSLHLPKTGGYILCPNHVSDMDPPLIAYYLYPRPVHYWAKIELSSVPILGWVIKHLYAIPIRRGKADRVAIKAAINVLSSGGILGAFPEGTRKKNTTADSELKKGAAFIAKKAQVPLVPCWISWKKKRVIIRFGQPITSEGTVDELTAKLESAIKRLH